MFFYIYVLVFIYSIFDLGGRLRGAAGHGATATASTRGLAHSIKSSRDVSELQHSSNNLSVSCSL